MGKQWLLCIFCLCSLWIASTAQMQGQTAVVPNLSGLNIPQATAALNKVGLALGNQTSEAWTQASSVPQNTISTQSVAAGQTAIVGSAVDVTVLRSPNVTLNYTDKQFTLINNTGAALDFNGLAFGTVDGAAPAAYAATRWSANLSAGGCAQVWAVARSSPQAIDGCAHISTWRTTNNPAEHFWIANSGVTRFKVTQNGVERGDCPAAPAGTQPMACSLYLPANASEGATPYLYFAYTTDRLIVLNQSADQFMPLTDSIVYNNNPNLTSTHQPLHLSDPNLYSMVNPVASVSQLAPSQCILYTNGADTSSLNTPQPCDVIARLDIGANLIFWSANFDLAASDGHQYTCNAAVAGQLTICVMPR